MMNISIVTYNTDYDEIKKLVDSLQGLKNTTIYIVDNSPKFNDQFEIMNVRYIHNKKNIGFGAAHNIAMKKSLNENSDYHLVLNPDIEVSSESIDKMLQHMESNKEVGLLMPKVVYPNGDFQYLCKLLPTPFDWIFRRFLPFKNIVEKRNQLYELRAADHNKIMNIPYLSGCFMLFRIEALKKIGLFDEKIFMYGEDTDITRRIYMHYKTIFYPDVSIIHHHNKESYRNKKLLWIHIKAAVYYFNKWGWLFDRERKQINKKVLKELKIK